MPQIFPRQFHFISRIGLGAALASCVGCALLWRLAIAPAIGEPIGIACTGCWSG